MSKLRELGVDALVIDLDGVVYRGEHALPGAVEAIGKLRAQGVSLLLCTNNSAPTLEAYRTKLQGMGIDVRPDELLTSAVVTAEVLGARGFAGRSALVVGGEGLRASLRAAGIVLDGRPDAVDAVVVGYDPSFDYDVMRRATLALRAGALFVASNDDATIPVAGGEIWPGAGAILASLVAASGRRPEVMGKPHPPMMDAAGRRLAGARRIGIVGDRADTDLAGGAAKGWTTILLLSGVTAAADVPRLERRPDVVLGGLADLVA